MARTGWRSLEQPIILPALANTRRKAVGRHQHLASGMTTASGLVLIENYSRVDGVAHLASGSFRLKARLTSRATRNQKHKSDRNHER